MSKATANIAFLTCLPGEQLALIGAHEIEEMHRYRGFALSFLPIKPCVSRLMVALGVECENRVASLRSTAEKIHLTEDFMAGNEVRGDRLAELRRQHYFVVDDNVAWLTLVQVLAAAYNSWQFHELMLNTCSTPELRALLVQFVQQKRDACRILEDLQDTLR
ncbi:hypothetical protein VRRI112168_15660 [Vreelandella rituensis]|uniref:Uncharacterized protein n=1 Tax=Vreelandella rituensis TaxID=2282306 RepID=A0A368TQB3_9GAMM|nr:hypothetical protein [Halomonas rituensis]RCV86778.1 hypothetical protein DU506_17800 [Halomonas rituensis]